MTGDVAEGGVVDDVPALVARVQRLSTEARHSFARDVARRAGDLGLVYFSDDVARPIAVALPTAPLSPATARERAWLARTVLGALVKTARAVLDGARGDEARAALLAELSPFEREVVTAHPFAPRLATARADLLVDDDGRLRLLEMNATIPAMQGYSDIAARAFVEVALQRFAGLSMTNAAERALTLLGTRTNADGLLRALLARYREDGGDAAVPSIALVHRRGDSQLGELRYLAERFRARGHEARTVVVDDVAGVAEGGAGVDIWYRHIFASRLDAAGPFATWLRASQRHHVYNPVAAPLEQKGLLAALSACAAAADDSERLRLSDDERAAVVQHVPFTRRLADHRTTIEGHTQALLPWVRAHRDALVLKRSQDFGGRSVVLGDRHEGGDSDWSALVDRCAVEGGWVVQERVRFSPITLTLATADEAAEADVYVDASAFTAHDDNDFGCVSRVSRSPVVNLQRGGALLALV